MTSSKSHDNDDNEIQIQVSDFEEKLLILNSDKNKLKLIDIGPINEEEE